MKKILFLILAVMILAAGVVSPLYAEGGAASSEVTTVWFPFAKSITNGIVVIVAQPTTAVTLYYI